MSAAASGKSSGRGADAPSQDDPNALVEDIDRTRAELGDTVEALVAKVDVKTRAQQRAAEVSTQAKEKLQTMKQELAGRAGQLTGKAEQTRQAAAANGKTVLGAGTAALGNAPEPVQRGAQQVARTVGRHRVPFAAAAGAVLVAVAGWLAVRRRRR
jgi:LPXTG-motif cell wall-anchored protein